jgi:serine/threonine-protein kinase
MATAEEAVAQGPEQADGYTARAFLRYVVNWDWPGAQADLDKAQRIDPSNSEIQSRYSLLLATLGRLNEAIVTQRKTVEADPVSGEAWAGLGVLLTANHEYQAAHQALDKALEINPGSNFWLPLLAELQLVEGNATQSLSTAQQITNLPWHTYCLAVAEQALNHARESEQALAQLITNHSHEATYQIAEVYGLRGDKDKAFEWLERAYDQHDSEMPDIKISPMLSNLRDDPRYRTLLRKMKLPE